MQTIRLRVNEKTYKYLMWFLGKFSKDEVEVIEENSDFLTTQAELRSELDKVEKGKSEFIDLQQLDDELENTIRSMKLKITKGFRDKLNAQVDFIAKDKPAAARNFKNDLLQKLRELPAMPFKHRKSIFFDRDDIRDLVFKGYVIVYKVNQEQKEIEVFGFVKYEQKLS